ncbi:MAG: tRNA threonylcarbamoyladenosine dehydratase [Bacteroidaceae bacterium]|nr:tRNA threonylcarbamoyladenosine dehydratase [Bacteroidaceae bacterium]
MTPEWLSRSELLLGEEGLRSLSSSHLLVVGLGGVGAYAAELAARAGVGEITIVDGDTVGITNLNRQLPATTSLLGKSKVEVMAQRILDINPNIKLHAEHRFLEPEEIRAYIEQGGFSFVIDAIDTIPSKTELIVACVESGVGLVSSMGAGGRLDVSAVRFADISKTENCSLARIIRKNLRERGIKSGVMTVFSNEPIVPNSVIPTNEKGKRFTVGTVSYIPAVFGCYLASYAIRKLSGVC